MKKGLSPSTDFKYLVGWEKPSALEREDEKDSWSAKDSPSGSPGWLWATQLAFQRLASEVTADAPPHAFVEGRPPRSILLGKDLSLCFTNSISAFHDSQGLPFNFFFSSSIIQVGNIPFCGFSWTPAQHQVQIEKLPLANFSIGRTTVLSTEPSFRPGVQIFAPGHTSQGFYFDPQASLMKISPSVVAASAEPPA